MWCVCYFSKKLDFISCESLVSCIVHVVFYFPNFIFQIFRHGTRTILQTYDTDPYKNESYWQPEGIGRLQNVNVPYQLFYSEKHYVTIHLDLHFSIHPNQ